MKARFCSVLQVLGLSWCPVSLSDGAGAFDDHLLMCNQQIIHLSGWAKSKRGKPGVIFPGQTKKPIFWMVLSLQIHLGPEDLMNPAVNPIKEKKNHFYWVLPTFNNFIDTFEGNPEKRFPEPSRSIHHHRYQSVARHSMLINCHRI